MTNVDDKPARRTPVRRRAPQWSARSLVVVMNGMLVGVGGVFVVTTSVPVTVVAAVAAVVLATVIVRERS